MEFHDDTAFDTSADADHFAADPDGGIEDSTDSGLSGGDDHYSMIANDGGDDPTGDHSDYGDNSPAAGTEASSTTGSTVSIEVDGHTYTGAAKIDSSGVAEADISLPDGDTVIALDNDQDGQADAAGILDSSGTIIDEQHEDPTSGQWIDDGVPTGDTGSDSTGTDPTGTDSSGSDPTGTDSSGSDDGYPSNSGTGSDPTGADGYPDNSSSGDGSTGTNGTASTGGTDGTGGTGGGATAAAAAQISVEAGGHEYTATETIDVNGDGRADSGVVEADGKTYLVTDFNGDGHGDHVEVGQDGQWKGGYSITPDGNFTPDPGTTPDESDLPGGSSYAVDPQTGEWVSGN